MEPKKPRSTPRLLRHDTSAPLEMKHPEAQSIFKYRDYREFIRDFYTSRKANDPKFSLRKMAKILSLPSHGHIIFLIDGARNAGGKSLAKMIHGFGFSGKEILYFENLVMHITKFFISEFCRLVENGVGNGEFAYVMQQSSAAQPTTTFRCLAHFFGNQVGEN